MTPTVPPELPPLPSLDYGFYEDYYDGWSKLDNPTERWCELNLYTEDSMREYGQQCYEAGVKAERK